MSSQAPRLVDADSAILADETLAKEKKTVIDALLEIKELKLAQESNPGSKAYCFYNSMEIVLEALDNTIWQQQRTMDELNCAMLENARMQKAYFNMVNRVEIMECLLASYIKARND